MNASADVSTGKGDPEIFSEQVSLAGSPLLLAVDKVVPYRAE